MADRSNLATVVEVADAASVRLILMEKKNAHSLELLLALTHSSLGIIKWSGKNVETCLMNAVEVHDQAWPDHNQCLFKFVVGTKTIEESDWRLDMRVGFETEKKQIENEQVATKGHSKKAKSKASKAMKAVLKKPSKP